MCVALIVFRFICINFDSHTIILPSQLVALSKLNVIFIVMVLVVKGNAPIKICMFSFIFFQLLFLIRMEVFQIVAIDN